MDLKISGHVAIVQGASKGIGLGIARALAGEGCDLVLTARSILPLTAACDQIAQEFKVRALPFALDSSHVDRAEELRAFVATQFGRLDILVCNSGGPPPGAFRDLKPEAWRDANDLLLVSPAAYLQTMLEMLLLSSSPRFFVVTSSSTREPVKGLTLSNVYRPGVVGLIKTLADEMGPLGLRCHSIAPGRIDTNRLAAVFKRQAELAGKSPEELKAGVVESIPARRLGEASDLGSLAAFLASPLADYLNGQNYLVDGGLIRSL